MWCKNLLWRSYRKQKIRYCKLYKQQITQNDCENCSNFNFVKNKPIKNRSEKLKKLESERDKNLIKNAMCSVCGRYSKLDSHEVYGGSNRKRSIQHGFVRLLCRECHSSEEVIANLRIETQKEFEKSHSREEFIKIIGKSYY